MSDWTIFNYADFTDEDGEFNSLKFLEHYKFEDHFFYLGFVKPYGTAVKIKTHIDSSPSIEVALFHGHAESIYSWDWPTRFKGFMSLPKLPIKGDWVINDV